MRRGHLWNEFVRRSPTFSTAGLALRIRVRKTVR
jgi:hypothetical protein